MGGSEALRGQPRLRIAAPKLIEPLNLKGVTGCDAFEHLIEGRLVFTAIEARIKVLLARDR